MQSETSNDEPAARHVILTCYDDRIDEIVGTQIGLIREQGGLIRDKDIIRTPGGVHLFTRSNCREAFYALLRSCSDIARSNVFHLWPHTNCQFCGRYHSEKIGTGAQSDLRYHLTSAKKMLAGAMDHFSRSAEQMPKIDVRIILTTDQRLITIDEAHDLLPQVPEHLNHGAPYLTHPPHPHAAENDHRSPQRHLHEGNGGLHL